MKRKVCLSIGILICSILLAIEGNVQAAVMQANPQTQYKTVGVLTDWMREIRGMEATNGTMGLSESYSDSTLLSTTASNNIDVHCALSTEWGAMAILSASGYGNPSNSKVITSTTGNSTGVQFQYRDDINWEMTASKAVQTSWGENGRYFNDYEWHGGSSRTGDALSREGYNECQGWHGAGESTWLNFYQAGYARGGTRFVFFWGG